jgi:hypothetical protein
MRSLRGAFLDYFVVEPGGEHVGEEEAAKFDIEANRG